MRNGLSCLVSIALLTSCSSTPLLKMEATRAPLDESVNSPNFKFGTLKKIMVVPPASTAKGQYDSIISSFERELLRNGVLVISGAITGRVSGDNMSDTEKALVLAKKSGADGILAIGEWAWTKEAAPKRFFIFEEAGRNYKEVSATEYQSMGGLKYSFPSSELRFVGRLLNTESGEVIASFEIKSPANYNLPYPYVAKVEIEKDKPTIKEENFAYTNSAWYGDARKATEGSIVKAVCFRLMHGTSLQATVIAATPAVVEKPEAPKALPAKEEEKREITQEEQPAEKPAAVAVQPAEEKEGTEEAPEASTN